ncbi:uncharacterized protein LOC126661900 [Mercurialis annua]|uniref:uncharacterized protein LOC126661900 n=1 Tax=Mercurialis annua TaxID=3986 RepID=UPI00215FB85F|nr:uncharacterized protein LOC126661900 [Mercurialis annua]
MISNLSMFLLFQTQPSDLNKLLLTATKIKQQNKNNKELTTTGNPSSASPPFVNASASPSLFSNQLVIHTSAVYQRICRLSTHLPPLQLHCPHQLIFYASALQNQSITQITMIDEREKRPP